MHHAFHAFSGKVVNDPIAHAPYAIPPDSLRCILDMDDLFIFKFLHGDILKLFGIRIVAARIEKVRDLAVLHIADDDMIRDARIQVLFDLRIHHIVILAVCPRHDVFIEGHGAERDQKRYQKDRQCEAEEALPRGTHDDELARPGQTGKAHE